MRIGWRRWRRFRIEARQDGFEDTMREQHRLIHSRIDGLDRLMQRLTEGVEENTKLLKEHISQEDEDRRQLLSRQTATIWTVGLGLGGWALLKVVDLLAQGGLSAIP